LVEENQDSANNLIHLKKNFALKTLAKATHLLSFFLLVLKGRGNVIAPPFRAMISGIINSWAFSPIPLIEILIGVMTASPHHPLNHAKPGSINE
jgi:hypothetical protein